MAGTKVHPVRAFLGKFRGVSAWMLELIMVLSAVPGKYADLAVVSALPGVVVVLSLVRGAPLLAADAPAGIRLARVGLPGLAPLPWSQTLAILVDALVSSLLVNDTAKVFLIRWRVPWAVA